MSHQDHPTLAESLIAEEARIEARSADFRKDLRLIDLVLAQILFMIGPQWIGIAAKIGQAHILFWLFAIASFFIPLIIVVRYLNRLIPLEGGIYQWAKLGFNELFGFLVAWNLWLYGIVVVSQLGLYTGSYFTYAAGPSLNWMAENKWFINGTNLAIIALIVIASLFGFYVNRWIHNVSTLIMISTLIVLITLLPLCIAQGTLNANQLFSLEKPSFSLFNLNILGKMGFGAFAGFEYAAIFAGECQNPARNIGRSIYIAAPINIMLYFLATSSVLAFVRPEDIDLVATIPQALSIGSKSFGLPSYIAPILIMGLLVSYLANGNLAFIGCTRLPMVAGWDHLLPNWFTKLHAKYKTPINSILFVGIATFLVGLVGIVGVARQEAYQILQSLAGIFYALAYLVMFALPIVGLRNINIHPPIWLKVASISGFLMTLLYILLSILPVVDVTSWFMFTTKIIAIIIITNIIGISIFILSQRTRQKQAVARELSAG